MQGEGERGAGPPVESGGSPPESSFPKGTIASARPVFGDRASIAVAVALMVALTLLFLPWSTIRPGLSDRGGTAGSGVGAAPSGSGPVLSAPVGISGIGISAVVQPVSVTLGPGPGSGPPAGGPGNHPKPPAGPGGPIGKGPPANHHTGERCHVWGCNTDGNHHRDGGHGTGGHGDGGNGHQGDGGHGHEGDGGQGHHGDGGHGSGKGGGKGGWGGHDGHDDGRHGCCHEQRGNDGRHGNHSQSGSRAVLIYLV